MKMMINIVVIVACIGANTYAAIQEYSYVAGKTLGPAEPFGSGITAKLINSFTELNMIIGDPEDDDEIRFVLESLPEKSLFQKRHHKCGTRIGVKLGENGPYFCKLESITFAIEGFEYPNKKKEYKRIKERIISFILFFKNKKTPPTYLEIPVFQTPSDVPLPDEYALKTWADSNDVGIFAPVDEIKLGQIDRNKRFKLNFDWLEDLLTHTVYDSQAFSGNPHKPGMKYYSTRPIVLTAEIVKQLEDVIYKYRK